MKNYWKDLLVFLLAGCGVFWYVNTHIKPSLQEQQASAVAAKKSAHKQADPLYHPRVKIITAPASTPSTAHAVSGGFVSDPRKLVIFPAVKGDPSLNMWKQWMTNLVENSKLDDYYVVRFSDVPNQISCKAPLPWVLQHCQTMCIVKGNKLLQVQGNSISDQEVKEILNKYKNW